MTPEQEALQQETERLLRAALHQHAQRIKPSPDAFFTINQRIARKEERLKLPALLRVRLQPSMVASIVLLIALSVVTTLLLTRSDNNPQSVDVLTTPSSMVSEPPETPTPPVTQPKASVPAETEGQEASGQQENQGSQSERSGQDPQVVTVTTPTTVPPSVSTSPSTSTSSAPATTATPPTNPPPPPQPTYAVRPLQVASRGRVIVYKDLDTSSEQLGIIPVSLDEGTYLSTGNRATDYSGSHWGEVRLPSGETGWVELGTVAIMPSPLSETQKNDLVTYGYQLLGIVAANEASDPAAPVYLSSTNLNTSNRSIYVATIVGPGSIYNRFTPSQFVNAFGAEDAAERSPVIASLYSQLACLAGEADVVFGDDSETAPPAAMQVLPYVAITGMRADNTCKVLLYFDYLSGQAEIIGFSVHS